jgi:hypothetical protein
MLMRSFRLLSKAIHCLLTPLAASCRKLYTADAKINRNGHPINKKINNYNNIPAFPSTLTPQENYLFSVFISCYHPFTGPITR